MDANNEVDLATQWSLPAIILATVCSLVAAANFTITCAILRKRVYRGQGFSKLTVVDMFVLNIAIADFATTGSIALALIISGGDLHNSVPATNLSMFCQFAAGGTSILLLLGLAFTRYRYVMDRNHNQLSDVSIQKGIVYVWVVDICIATGMLAAGTAHPDRHGLTGFIGAPGSTLDRFRNFSSVVFVCVPAGGIFWFHRRMMQEIEKDTIDATLTKKVARMIFLLNLVYFVTLLPIGGLSFYSLVTGNLGPEAVDLALYMLAVCNFVANPVIYCACQWRYRAAVLALPGIRYFSVKLGGVSADLRTSSAHSGLKQGNRNATRSVQTVDQLSTLSGATCSEMPITVNQIYCEASNNEYLVSNEALPPTLESV